MTKKKPVAVKPKPSFAERVKLALEERVEQIEVEVFVDDIIKNIVSGLSQTATKLVYARLGIITRYSEPELGDGPIADRLDKILEKKIIKPLEADMAKLANDPRVAAVAKRLTLAVGYPMSCADRPLHRWIQACEISPWGRPQSVGMGSGDDGSLLQLHWYEHKKPMVAFRLERGTVINATIYLGTAFNIVICCRSPRELYDHLTSEHPSSNVDRSDVAITAEEFRADPNKWLRLGRNVKIGGFTVCGYQSPPSLDELD